MRLLVTVFALLALAVGVAHGMGRGGGGGLGFGRAGDGAWFGVKNLLKKSLGRGGKGGGHPHNKHGGKRNFIRKNLPPGMVDPALGGGGGGGHLPAHHPHPARGGNGSHLHPHFHNNGIGNGTHGHFGHRGGNSSHLHYPPFRGVNSSLPLGHGQGIAGLGGHGLAGGGARSPPSLEDKLGKLQNAEKKLRGIISQRQRNGDADTGAESSTRGHAVVRTSDAGGHGRNGVVDVVVDVVFGDGDDEDANNEYGP